ncbi:M14 family metallopeptidase [Maribacter sp. 2307ULW6-5]|uniref:M14 family metallopeptidase n=1 Tax=Maribacter sp. 2307ULW6-5 TaxID=3386275 RepID=UPI0039BD2F43
MYRKIWFALLTVIVVTLASCKPAQPTVQDHKKKTSSGYQGQGTNPIVPTVDRPVQKQWRGVWAFNDSTVFFSNDFAGARLNGVAQNGAQDFTVWITAENTPINVSPWYAFKIWSLEPENITVTLNYQNSRSRYYPKISKNGAAFTPLDSLRFTPIGPGEGEFGIKAVPEAAKLSLAIDATPTYVAAQELYTQREVKKWVDSLSQLNFVKNYPIGTSKEGRPIDLMEMNEANNGKKAIMVIARQHPPEVTGFLAMKAFVETLAGPSAQATAFRKEHQVFVVPLMNPDGVHHGHWRHNMGGIDLNRDWQNFNQPETQSVRNFLMDKDSVLDFVFGVDFHSTWDDIYYPLDTLVTGKAGDIVFQWINGINQRLPQKKTNVSASKTLEPTMVSRNYFFKNHGMPSIVFELGDNTPRPFLKLKGRVAAEELMRLLMER